jgi:hypothetical protein
MTASFLDSEGERQMPKGPLKTDDVRYISRRYFRKRGHPPGNMLRFSATRDK